MDLFESSCNGPSKCKQCKEAYESHTIVRKYSMIYDEYDKSYIDINSFLTKQKIDLTQLEKDLTDLQNTLVSLVNETIRNRSKDEIDTMMRCIDQIPDEYIRIELNHKVSSK